MFLGKVLGWIGLYSIGSQVSVLLDKLALGEL